MPVLNPRNVHVLFVHGVGTHSKLSSLLQAYQSLRANIHSPEAPTGDEDWNPEWALQSFDDGTGTSKAPHLKLATAAATPGATKAVYLYEVNYSALAGVVRANQPLDMTGLFVGLDLAINVARKRLNQGSVGPRPLGYFNIDDKKLAVTVQKLSGVFVAATVPILGIPSLVFSRFTQGIVAIFTRFFEDIATFALDRSGEGLISAHVDRTVESIFNSPDFKEADEEFGRDILVVAAHSLGTIVTHSYLIRHGLGNGGDLPARVLTFGSPIGLVGWLWLFLDFIEMDFKKRDLDASRYFSWKPLVRAPFSPPLPAMQWINVVNRLDPIATAFPLDYVNLAQTPIENAAMLIGGRIHQRFIDTGDGAGTAHTAYFDDRKGFLEILGRLCGLRDGPAEAVLDPDVVPKAPNTPIGRSAAQHWKELVEGLERLSLCCLVLGWLAIALYLGIIAWGWASPWPMMFLVLFGWPPLTIGTLAFFQRLICSKPTKRTPGEAIEALPRGDLWSKPHQMRQSWRRRRSVEEEREYVLASGPGWKKKVLMWLLSFAPSLSVMLLPVFITSSCVGGSDVAWQALSQHWNWILPGMLALFTIYVIAFAIREFATHWRTLVLQATARN